MKRRRGRWWQALEAIALALLALVAVVVLVVLLPFVAPVIEWIERRAARRKRDLARHWPCGWCRVPLGEAALTRADLIHDAYVDTIVGEDKAMFLRLARTLDACCPRCDGGHRHSGKPDRFELLDLREFARFYGPYIGTAVPQPSGDVPWPWREMTWRARPGTTDRICIQPEGNDRDHG